MKNMTRWYFTLFFIVLFFLFGISIAQATSQIGSGKDGALPVPTPTSQPGVGDGQDKPVLSEGGPAYPVPNVGDKALGDGETAVNAPPVITVWHESDLAFGHRGNPQKWVNILGNVTNVSFANTNLTYRLNGASAQPASIGSDNRRLAQKGDFNLELDYQTLINGTNTVVIVADKTTTGEIVTKTLTFDYDDDGGPWPETYAIDWSNATSIHDVAQIVDGEWAIQSNALRPQFLSYDRLVAIGDGTGWTDYEVEVPVTIHGIDASDGFNPPSYGPGVGMILRWDGHYQETSEQPFVGWKDLGALGWYRWAGTEGSYSAGLQMIGYSIDSAEYNYEAGGNILDENGAVQLQTGITYIYKMRVETTAEGSTYRFKVWQQGSSEPATWDMEGDIPDPNAPLAGSLVLVSHHVDASFGNVSVTPLSTTRPVLTVPPPQNGTVDKSPDQTDYAYNERVILTADPATGYYFGGWTGDVVTSTNQITVFMTSDKTIAAQFTNKPESDDFNNCTLASQWTYSDPVGNSTMLLNGTQLVLSVPAGSNHDVWVGANTAPRIMQPTDDTDFEIEVKFDTTVNSKFQLQGIIIQQDSNNFLRFDFYNDGTNTNIFYAKFENGSVDGDDASKATPVVGSGSPMYMRIKREGDVFTQSYKLGNGTWETDGVTHVSIAYPGLNVTQSGVFAGNAGVNPANAPAFTAVIDYVFNTAAPISPEDPDTNILTLSSSSRGTIEPSPNKSNYACGEEVTLTAVHNAGWLFSGWSGAAAGGANPYILTISGDHTVAASYVEITDYIYLPMIMKNP